MIHFEVVGAVAVSFRPAPRPDFPYTIGQTLPESETRVHNIDLAYLLAVNDEIDRRTEDEAARLGFTDLRSRAVTRIYADQRERVVAEQGVDDAELDRVANAEYVEAETTNLS